MIPLEELFWSHLHDLYASEQEIVTSLDRLSRAAADSDLQTMLVGYQEEARGQVKRLEAIFAQRDRVTEAQSSDAVAGSIWWKPYIDSDLLDAGLIIGVRFLAEYKIAAYRAAQRWATLLGYEALIETLQVSLDEEERACRELVLLGEGLKR